MAVIRVNKTKDYTVMSNYHLKDKRLSLKAKGLLSTMLSLSDEWQYSIAGLVAISKEKETAITSTLKELKANGYLIITKKLPHETSSGRYEYEYDIYEKPQDIESQELPVQDIEKQGVENLGLEFLGLEFQGVENQGQLNTNISNTKELTTNKKKKESKKNSFDVIIAEYAKGNEELTDLLGEWLKVRKAKRAAMTDRAIQMNIDKLDSLAKQSSLTVVEYLKEVICRGWAAFYVINNYDKKRKEIVPSWAIKDTFFTDEKMDEIEKRLREKINQPKTVAQDEELRKRAEALKESLS